MKWIKNVGREILGLFVDDSSFALAILVWIALVWLYRQRIGGKVPSGVVLFAGLTVILVESLIRFSRRKTQSQNP
jgi:hypothetical protein